MKHGGRENTRNHLEIEGKGEEDTIHLNLRVPQILIWKHLNLIVIQTWIRPHYLTLVIQVMKGVRRERDLLKETNTDGEKEGINDVTKGERGVIKDPSADQKERQMVLRILKVKVKVALIVMAWMFLEKIRSGKTVLRILLQNSFPWPQKKLLPVVAKRGMKPSCLKRKRENPPRRMERREAMASNKTLNLTEAKIDNLT